MVERARNDARIAVAVSYGVTDKPYLARQEQQGVVGERIFGIKTADVYLPIHTGTPGQLYCVEWSP